MCQERLGTALYGRQSRVAETLGVSGGDLGAGMQFNLFNSTPSIPFGDAVVQLHGPNAE